MQSLTTKCKPALAKLDIHFFGKKCLTNCSAKEHYDIVIVGGGIIGSTLSCTLGKNNKFSNKRILLLESTKNRQFVLKEQYSNRVVSVNPGTQKLLSQIDAWKHIEAARFATVKRLQVADALSDASITFGDEASLENISYIVENDLLVAAVQKEIQNIDNVTTLYESKIEKIHLPDMTEQFTQFCLGNGKEYTCDLLIGCDGFNSQVRQAMGVQYLNWKYDNMGIVATLNFSEEIDNCIAWQRMLPTGPIALLPLTTSKSSLVWSTTPEHTRHLLKLPEEQFVDAVNEALYKEHKRSNLVNSAIKAFDNLVRATNIPVDVNRRYPPKITSVDAGSQCGFPFGFGHAVNYIGKGVALVGDAAHRVHPLAGQGVNLGFGDVSCMNKVLSEAVYAGSSIGSPNYLRDYEMERQKHNVSMMAIIEGMYRLYRTDFTPVVLMRSLGLQAADILKPLKRMMETQASI